MKKKINNLKKNLIKYIEQNQTNSLIIGISLVALIIGTLSIGFFKALLIVLAIDCIIIIPGIVKVKKSGVKMKKKNYSSAKKGSNVKTADKKNNSNTKKSKKRKLLKKLLMVFFILCIIGLVCGIIFAAIIVKDAPKFDPKNLDRSETTIVYDKNGKQFAKIGAEKREKVTYDELPEVLVNAIVATEDSRYFQHNGFDLPRFLKASILQALGSSSAGGASTLTMQVVKNNYTSTVSSGFDGIKRKFTDIYMAIFKVEKKYTKQEILEFYVNSNYLGSGSYGVEQACLTYFGKSAKDINLAEAAMIAGLFQAPNSLDPIKNPEAAEKRRKTVLYLMHRHGYITKEEKEQAEKLTIDKLLKTTTSTEENKYQAFLDTVVEEVETITGNNPYTTSMQIYTTMDPEKQEHLDKVMSGELYSWENEIVTAGISVLDVKDGSIAAIGAGRNRSGERSYNNATMINKQIGSTAKPLYDYAMGIEHLNWSDQQIFGDEPYTYSNGVSVNNWDGNFKGTMTLRDTLAQSRNIPALKAFQANDKDTIQKFVKSVGLSPDIKSGSLFESHSLGSYNGENPLSMSAAYSVFANGGYYIKPYSFTKIVYRSTGEVYETKVTKTRVLSEETAYIMSNILQSAGQYGLGRYNNINGAVFGAKTGTTSFDDATKRDNNLPSTAINDLWVDGISPDYAISVWYGYKKIDSTYVTKINSAAHMRLFQAVAKGVFKTGSNWTKPSGVVQVAIEKETNPVKLPSEFTPSDMITTALYKTGSEPTEVSTRFSELANVTNLTAKENDGKVTLSWTVVQTPDAIDKNKITDLFKTIYTNQSYLNNAVNNRINYNNNYIGTVSYQVYKKSANGTLTLLGSTQSNTYTDSSNSSTGSVSYVVKTAYTIFKANMSSGTETKVQVTSVADLITFDLNGNATVTITKGSTYTEPNPPVVVLNNGVIDSSKTATVTKKEIKKDSKVVNNIDTNTVGTYNITYTVKYGTTTDTLLRTIIVK